MARRPRIGDVFEFPTSIGLAYAQYTNRHWMLGRLIRIAPGLFAERPPDLRRLVEEDEEVAVFFPALADAVRQGDVIFVGHAEVPERKRELPPLRGDSLGRKYVRRGEAAADETVEWVDAFLPEDEKLPEDVMWNWAAVIVQILERAGYPQEAKRFNDALPEPGTHTMGMWGAGIFDDDTAADVRLDYVAAVDEGASPSEATHRVLESWRTSNADPDQGPVIWLALAAVQLDRNELQEPVRAAALDVIERGAGLDRWREAGEEALRERRAVLEELRRRLAGA
jgi:hypothetical protein